MKYRLTNTTKFCTTIYVLLTNIEPNCYALPSKYVATINNTNILVVFNSFYSFIF